MRQDKTQYSLNVGTWNIWVYGDRNAKRLAETIDENNIDIIGLQEVAKYHDETPIKDMCYEIANHLDYEYTFYPAYDFRPDKPYEMGNAVVSQYPIKESSVHILNPETPYDGTYRTEPRTVTTATIQLNGMDFQFSSTHLQYSHRFQETNERETQAKNLTRLIDTDKPNILVGDFNAPIGNKTVELVEDQQIRCGPDKSTWTMHKFEHDGWVVNTLDYCIDHIFTTEHFQHRETTVINTDISDHLPVKTELLY